MPKNKVKYGLKNVYFAKAVIDELTNTATYATPKPWPGGVSLSLDQQGDTTKFRADNIDYWVGTSNNGYSGDLESALIPEDFRTDILGDVKDGNGVLVENAGAKTVHFALLFQFEGDQKNTRHVLYNCTATRPSVSGQTTDETIEPQTETVTITAVAIHNAAYDLDVVKARALENDAPYAKWFENVYMPTPDGVISPDVAAATGEIFGYDVDDLQSDVTVSDDAITGVLKKVTDGALVPTWGEGYFIALQLSKIPSNATSCKVGLTPSAGSGLVEIIDDPDKNGTFKISDPNEQRFTVVTSNGVYTKTDYYDLSGLVLAAE